MADYGPVNVKEKSIQALIDLYSRTYGKMIREIEKSTDAGKINKARVMARINAELEALGVDVKEWVDREIPQYYLDGANVAVQDLRALGVDVSKSSAFAVINKEALRTLMEETALNFANGITALSRNSRRIIDNTLKQQLNFIIAQGKLSGEARRTISSALKMRLQEEGIDSITDKAGRSWSFNRYTEMLARTKAVEARNQGLVNRMMASGYDLVQITNHGTDHPACAKWEGQILSVSGLTPGYPTLEEARASGLFHPNCKHAMNVLHPELAQLTIAYKNPYNYRAAASAPGHTPPAPARAGKPRDIVVYHGKGNNVLPSGSNMFGDAFYVSRSEKTAQVFGSVEKSVLHIRPGQVLKINNQAEYSRFVSDAMLANPGLDPQQAFPALAKSLGYKAVEVSESFDPLGGIAVFEKSLIK